MATATGSEELGPIATDPGLRFGMLLVGLVLVAVPGALSLASTVSSDRFLDAEPAVLSSVRELVMQTQPVLADGLRSFSQALPGLLVASWFRKNGRLSRAGWIAGAWLLACFAAGAVGTWMLADVSPNNVDGGSEALRVLRNFSQMTAQSACTYLAVLIGLTGGGANR